MQLAQIEGFLEVARHSNLSRAAEALFITQPALTARLRALETHVKQQGRLFFEVSGAAGDGIDALMEAAWREIVIARNAVPPPDDEPEEGTDLISPARLRRDA